MLRWALMPNFNAVAHLVRPAERAQTDRQTDRYTSKDRRTPFHKSERVRASRAQRWGKGARFARTKVIQYHVDTLHEGLRGYQCNMCDKNFTRDCDLKRHIRTVMRVKGVICVLFVTRPSPRLVILNLISKLSIRVWENTNVSFVPKCLLGSVLLSFT